MALFQELHAEGATILIVTHEPEISTYTERIIELRDGRVIRDQPVFARGDAAATLQSLGNPEPAGVA
jgi:putative ABC transport system ATP-binding protein